jgi:3-phenylpropionate/trans-cinnamate dioxygenase ferredoxin reductase subunit
MSIRRAESVVAIEGDESVEAVVTASGERIEADIVLIGVGSVPNVRLAEHAGIKVANGIVVDEFCRTSEPNIFAAGDVTNHFNPRFGAHMRLEAWQSAQNQGVVAGRNIAGLSEPYQEVPWLWSDQLDLNIQVAGVLKPGDNFTTRGDVTTGTYITFGFREDRLVGACAVSAGRPATRDLRLAHMLLESRVAVSATMLASSDCNLKALLRSA